MCEFRKHPETLPKLMLAIDNLVAYNDNVAANAASKRQLQIQFN